jgi:mannonate dehydratase
VRHVWRWFGPIDKVTLQDALQSGARGIVSALHHVPTGEVWPKSEIEKRDAEIKAAGLTWDVVESIPISEDIKTQTGEWQRHIANWQETLRRLASIGIKTVCYNFMPVLDWTRTDLRWNTWQGAKAMRFELEDFVAFDLHVLKRSNAAMDYPDQLLQDATKCFNLMTPARIAELSKNIGAGLPGSADGYTLDELRAKLRIYDGITREALQQHLFAFLKAVVPVAEEVGINICAHPDDPPWALLGLPRILSTEMDYAQMLAAVDSRNSGVTLCTGSLGAHFANDIPKMIKRFGPRIHFVHLRNVSRDSDAVPCSFFEDQHLEGSTDMIGVVEALLDEERRRRDEGRIDHELPMRPDHGQEILDDLSRGAQPGYPAIGRLKGLAELRGIERAITHLRQG